MPSAVPNRSRAVQEAPPHVGRHRIVRRQEPGKGTVEAAGPPGWAASDPQRRPQGGVQVVQRGDGEQSDHRLHGHPDELGKLGAPRPRRRDRPIPGPAGKRAGQIGFVQHRQRRASGGGDRVGVLGFDHLRGDVDNHVGVACRRRRSRRRRDPRRDFRRGPGHAPPSRGPPPGVRAQPRAAVRRPARRSPSRAGQRGRQQSVPARQRKSGALVPSSPARSIRIGPIARSRCRAADRASTNGGICVAEMRATVYLLPAEGNCWVSIWIRGGNIACSWATMDKCMRNPGSGSVPTRWTLARRLERP